VKIKAPPGWDTDLWRQAREVGLECVLVVDNPDFELLVDTDTHNKGVRSTGPDKEFLKIMQAACIKGLTEPNPEWRGEWCEKPMHTKPKDMGWQVSSDHLKTTISIGSTKELQRLSRCRSQLVRSIISAFVTLSLIQNKLP